jgi:hypothetical protein
MQVDSSMNNYATLMQYQRPSIPEQPEESPITIPEFDDQEIIETIKDVTQEIKNNLQDNLEEKVTDYEDENQAKKDNTRAFLADYAGVQSKKNQWDIYMSVMTDSEVDTSNDNSINFLKNLRDVQEQNNRVEAYALYQDLGLQ